MKILMDCREYTHKTCTGELAAAAAGDKIRAALHRAVCPPCRHFAHNDAQLDAILQHWRARHDPLPAAPGRQPPANGCGSAQDHQKT